MELKMLKKRKQTAAEPSEEGTSPKKQRKSEKSKTNHEKVTKVTKNDDKPRGNSKESKQSGNTKRVGKGEQLKKPKIWNKFGKKKLQKEKPADWKEYKKKVKQVRLKRKQSKNLYDLITKAKKMSEQLRIKKLEGGVQEKQKICNELHKLLGNRGIYAKLILAHDMARIIQYMIKFSMMEIRKQIATEMIELMVPLFQSKYATFCISHLMKYSDSDIRYKVMNACYGNAVKLTSHSVSAPVFNHAYSTWATPLQKQHFMQEFFGDLYKQSKDDKVKHLRDVYKNSPDMKSATLSATKANLQRILNKELLDSQLVHTVLMQFLQECSEEDRGEMISLLNSHVAILSNSKDGSQVSKMCIWFGTNKDKKILLKSLKEHVKDLCKHEYGHSTIITLLDSVDDTVLLNKIILQEIIGNCNELMTSEYGRKVLTWLVAPEDSTHFHPVFLKELEEGKEKSHAKKDTTVRRNEILNYVSESLLKQLCDNFNEWFSDSTKAMVVLAVLKSGTGEALKDALGLLTTYITNPVWKVTEKETEIPGLEQAGYHMFLKKLIKHDGTIEDLSKTKFSQILVEALDNNIIKKWIKSNRQCFLFVSILETNTEDVGNNLKEKLLICMKTLKKQHSPGAKLLVQKLNNC